MLLVSDQRQVRPGDNPSMNLGRNMPLTGGYAN